MATVRHFADMNGETVELVRIDCISNKEFAAKFPGVQGRRWDSFSMMVGYTVGSRDAYPVTRTITYKSRPSLHVCDARCMGARGRTMNCECQCGGKNHGKAA